MCLICLSFICALYLLPQTVFADDVDAQTGPAEVSEEVNSDDDSVKTDPDDAAVQTDPSDVPAAADTDGVSAQTYPDDAVVQSDPSDAPAAADTDSVSAQTCPDDATVQIILTDAAETVPADGATPEPAAEEDISEAGKAEPVTSVSYAASGEDEKMTDDTDTDNSELPAAMLLSGRGAAPEESEYPSRFDLHELGRVTPVKLQSPWGACWAFAATAAAESSILTKMDSTYAETGLDLSERQLAWYAAQPVTENISTSQAGEGLHLYDENPNNIYLYAGRDQLAGTLYAQGIGPVPESEYPYRGLEGNLAYDTLLSNKGAYIEAKMTEFRPAYPFLSEDDLRSMAEQIYDEDLSSYKDYDTYSQFDDWTISEADEPGSGKLLGSPYTLIDNNVFIYWVLNSNDGIDSFGKKPLAVIPVNYDTSMLLYKDSIDQIKSELYSGNGVAVDISMNNDSLNKETWAQYYDGGIYGNTHAVCIVGWDDDYDASNFNNAPPGNGAWIVKNSYGSQTDMIPGGLVAADGTTRDANGGEWGIVDENGLHNGCFYLSYYDTGIGVPESFNFDLRENHDQENALQLDFMPASADEWTHKSETPIWCANVFTLEKDMRIDEVATRFSMADDVPLTGFTVIFDIYRLNSSAAAPDDGELIASCTREFSNLGYHRVELDAPVYSKAGDRLAVVVRQRHDYEDGSVKYVASSQASSDYKSDPQLRYELLYGTPVINEGESFLKIEDITDKDAAATGGWIDLCAPLSRAFLWYLNPEIAENASLSEYYESIAVGKPIKDVYSIDNFGIKAFGEPVTLEHVEAVAATSDTPGNKEYWRDPLTNRIFADESGTQPLTEDDVYVSPLGHDLSELPADGTDNNSSPALNPDAGSATNSGSSCATSSGATSATHPNPVPTGDEADSAFWYTLFAATFSCFAALLTIRRKRRHADT